MRILLAIVLLIGGLMCAMHDQFLAACLLIALGIGLFIRAMGSGRGRHPGDISGGASSSWFGGGDGCGGDGGGDGGC